MVLWEASFDFETEFFAVSSLCRLEISFKCFSSSKITSVFLSITWSVFSAQLQACPYNIWQAAGANSLTGNHPRATSVLNVVFVKRWWLSNKKSHLIITELTCWLFLYCAASLFLRSYSRTDFALMVFVASYVMICL